MKHTATIKINFTGGIISPGDLMNILVAAESCGVGAVSFGLRQQLYIKVATEILGKLAAALEVNNIHFETDSHVFPNIVSSYPAEEIFIAKTWLGEGVYKDIFDAFEYTPKLKVNISDSRQGFTPLLTGNINWVASDNVHYWHLFIRFPKTNSVYEWPDIVYTNDIAAITRHIEFAILSSKKKFYDTATPHGEELYNIVMQQQQYIVKPAETKVTLPPFMLPYYEGFNKVNDKYWLGIYRRDEQFSVAFLKDVCALCQATKIGQLCCTPWKGIIIKGIAEKNRGLWDAILGRHQINVRHAANELNFQVEDDCAEGLQLKNYLVKHLQKDDTRTFGICIGIKTRRKSEVFSSILIKRKPLFTVASIGFLYRYDILCAKDFNPNQRTGATFSTNNLKWFLPKELKRAVINFYETIADRQALPEEKKANKEAIQNNEPAILVYQCPKCLSVYDEVFGELETNITAGTLFKNLPTTYCCPLCETPKQQFEEVAKSTLMQVTA